MDSQRDSEKEVIRETREVRSEDGGGMGFLLGILLIIVLLVLFFIYGLPNRDVQEPVDNDPGIDVDVNLPTGGEDNGGADDTDTDQTN